MTAQFTTLRRVIDDIQYRGNLAGYENRHGRDRLIELWNDSNQALRELIAQQKDSPYLTRTAPATLPTVAAVTGEVYASVDWPLDALSIHSVRVKDGDDRWRPLKEILPDALHDYQNEFFGDSLRLSNLPIAYVVGNVPKGTGDTEVPGTIELVPVPQSGEYSVWYIQAWAPLEDEDDVVNSIASFLDWTVWDVVIKASAKNGKGGHTYKVAASEREKCERRIITRAQRLSSSGDIPTRNGRHDGYRRDFYGEF